MHLYKSYFRFRGGNGLLVSKINLLMFIRFPMDILLSYLESISFPRIIGIEETMRIHKDSKERKPLILNYLCFITIMRQAVER